MQLTPFCLVMSYIKVSPNRSQFLRYSTVSLSCEDQFNSTGWKVKKKTVEGWVKPCSSGGGFTSSGSVCIIRNIYPTDNGVYWCESPDRKKSSSINITTTDRTLILESPAMPVSEGATVTLGCEGESSPNPKFIFYKDGRPIGSSSTGVMTIQSVSKTDEGLYMCSSSSGVESESSWLTVEASLPPSTQAPDAASCSVSVSRFMCHLVVGIPYLLSTILLGLIYRDKNRAAARPKPQRGGSNDVIMEIVV